MTITYADPEDPYEDQPQNRKMPKYRMPTTEFQRRILRTVRMKHFPDDTYKFNRRRFKSVYIMIEKSMVSLSMSRDGPNSYEWVEAAISWVTSKRLIGKKGLKALTSFIKNNDRMQDFIAAWLKKNSDQDIVERTKFEY